mgnify:CR=1 FL=1|tara:strand:+ start:4916 stop:7189 length:2274 start_codon:yes stop_codon:yes gene_type:complete
MIQIFKLLRLALFLFALLGFNNLYGQQYNVTNAKGTILSLVNNQVFVSAVTPSDAFEADVWFNTSDRITYVYDGAIWKEIDEDRVTTSSTAPTDPVQGDVWFDSSAVLITTNIYDGSSWLLVSSSDDQLLSIDGDSLRLEDGGAVALDSLDNQTLSLVGNTLSIENGNSIVLINQLIDNDGDTHVQVEKNTDDDIIRFDAEGLEAFTVSSSQVIVKNEVDLIVEGTGSSQLASAIPYVSWVTIADISTWDSNSITLASLTAGVVGFSATHNFAEPNITGRGITVSNPAIVVGNLATSYWIYGQDTGFNGRRFVKAQFQLSGSDLQVRFLDAKFVQTTLSLSPAQQTDAYFTNNGVSSSLTIVDASVSFISTITSTFFIADNSTSRVGIGTETPSERLEVVGNTRFNGNVSIDTVPSNYSLDINGSFKVQTLGLSNNTAVASRTNGGLDFTSPDYTMSDAIIYTSFVTGSNVSSTQIIYESGGSGLGTDLVLSGNLLRVYAGSTSASYTSSTISPNTSYSVAVVYDLTGDEIRVYIRKLANAPLRISDLADSEPFTESSWAGSGGTGVGALNGSSVSGFSGNFLGTGLSQIVLYTSNDISAISTANISRSLVFSSEGNVGIGTQNPTQNLSVNGDAGKTGGGSWSTFSDRRVKTDIQTYSKGLNEIMEINPVTFKYKENSGYSNTSKDYVGIIAQEIEQVLPSMVDQIDDSQGPSGLSDKRVFDSSELLWTLINAVKELKTENDSLKEKLKQQGLIVD